jgi:hypothetical protein
MPQICGSLLILYNVEKWWKGNKTPLPDPATCVTLLNSKQSNLSNYLWFYDDVLSTVVGRNHWRKQCIHTTGTKLASVTDEALGLLILDNSWVYWCIRSAGPDKPYVMVEALAVVDPSGTTGVDWESLSKEKQILARKPGQRRSWA